MNKGITLIETLIYIALFALIMVGALSFAVSLIFQSQEISADILMEEEANFIFKKIDYALNGGDIVKPDFEDSEDFLEINNSEIFVFDISNDFIRLRRGTENPVNLSSSKVRVSDLLFSYLGENIKNGYLKINFKMESFGIQREFEKIRQINI